jgi:hypothetical protein
MANQRHSTHGVMHRLLAQPRISIVTSHPDVEVGRLRAVLGEHVEIDGRSALEHLLGELLRAVGEPAPTAKTLDLIGHATPDGLLQIGDWTLDGENPTVTAFFRGIAELEILPRLGVTALRLLGPCTAVAERGRTALQSLAVLLELEVFGTVGPIHASHYDASGFREQSGSLLSAASAAAKPAVMDVSAELVSARSLDIEALPLVPMATRSARALRIVHEATARGLLSLIDRTRGAHVPGLLALPSQELALIVGSQRPDLCRIAQVILGGHFVRVYPVGDSAAGLLYPVHDPGQLFALANELPATWR